MNRNLLNWIVAFGIFAWGAPTPVSAAQKATKQNGKAGGKKAPTAAEARQSVVAANKKINEGGGELKAAEKKMTSASSAAARRAMDTSGLAKAVKELQAAQSEFAGIKSTLVKVVHERSDWLAATEAAREAGVKLRALADQDLSADEKRSRRSELSAITRRPNEIENAELTGNGEYSAALKTFEKAAEAEKKARAQYAREISQDEEYKKAKAALDVAKKAIADGQKELTQAQRELTAAQRAEAQAKQAAQAKQKQQAKKKNSPNNNKGKGKGKK